MTIYEIKYLTEDTSPYFFSRKTMKMFGQTMRSFRVKRQPDGRYRISAPMLDRFTGRHMGETVRYFNPSNNRLEREEPPKYGSLQVSRQRGSDHADLFNVEGASLHDFLRIKQVMADADDPTPADADAWDLYSVTWEENTDTADADAKSLSFRTWDNPESLLP